MDTWTEMQAEALDKFRRFCQSDNGLSHFDELDWYALSIGFFIACGITDADELSKLALHARYRENYWT
jgi:hypothetical protein